MKGKRAQIGKTLPVNDQLTSPNHFSADCEGSPTKIASIGAMIAALPEDKRSWVVKDILHNIDFEGGSDAALLKPNNKSSSDAMDLASTRGETPITGAALSKAALASCCATFDTPAHGEFSAVFVAEPPANFASLNAGDPSLYVGGAAINRAFRDALEACGHDPKDRYEVLHEALLRCASAAPGHLHWLSPDMVFPKPASRADLIHGNCSYCQRSTECWEVSWVNWQGEAHCAQCWGYYTEWAFRDVIGFCGLVPKEAYMERLRPVGLVSIALFPEDKRPCGSSRNVAMVYVVGPNCERGRRSEDDMSVDTFLHVLESTGAAIMEAVTQYCQAACSKDLAAKKLPSIDVLRVCLLSGGAFKHPDASKVDVAMWLIKGLVSKHGRDGASENRLPALDFAWDDDVFRIAWQQLLDKNEAQGVACKEKEEEGDVRLDDGAGNKLGPSPGSPPADIVPDKKKPETSPGGPRPGIVPDIVGTNLGEPPADAKAARIADTVKDEEEDEASQIANTVNGTEEDSADTQSLPADDISPAANGEEEEVPIDEELEDLPDWRAGRLSHGASPPSLPAPPSSSLPLLPPRPLFFPNPLHLSSVPSSSRLFPSGPWHKTVVDQ